VCVCVCVRARTHIHTHTHTLSMPWKRGSEDPLRSGMAVEEAAEVRDDYARTR
jgi:hypothetical protein